VPEGHFSAARDLLAYSFWSVFFTSLKLHLDADFGTALLEGEVVCSISDDYN